MSTRILTTISAEPKIRSEVKLKDAVNFTRRNFLKTGAAALSACALTGVSTPSRQQQGRKRPTNFQIACMTLPYADFPLQRALEGIAACGYRYVAWGTRHREADGRQRPVMDIDASPSEAKKLGDRCHSMG